MNTTVIVNGSTPTINVTSSSDSSISVSIAASATVEPSVSVSVEESSISVAASVEPSVTVNSSTTLIPISVSVEESSISVGIPPTSSSIFVSSQPQGARGPAGPMGTVEGFEAIVLNIKNYNKTFIWDNDVLLSIIFTTPDGTITETYNYDVDENLTSKVLSGAIPSGFPLTKSYTYDVDGTILSISYS